MKESDIAACGMNCALCSMYQSAKDPCSGCRGAHIRKACQRCVILRCKRRVDVSNGFCYECTNYPCARLRNLNARYEKNHGMSMLDNLSNIQTEGLPSFVEREEKRWRCPACGGTLCVHRRHCLSCKTPKPL